MFKISCFADEISPDLNEQIEVMKRNNVKFVEFRSVWDKNVSTLTDDELKTVKDALDAAGIKVSAVGSPIGKVNIADDFEEHMKKFERILEIAKKLETRYIRLFSFYLDKTKEDSFKDEIISRLKRMVALAEKYDVVLLHENEGEIYGESSKNCKTLLDAVNSKRFLAVFDPANFVIAGENVYPSCYEDVKKYIEYIHVKDAVLATKEIVVAGAGDGGFPEIFAELRNKDGMFVSLEPHLAKAGQFKGFTGPALFEEALAALRGILDKLKIEYV